MKVFSSVLTTFVVTAGLVFTGCSMVQGTNSSYPSSSAQLQSGQSETDGDLLDQKAFREALESVSGYEPGTAGSSLKIYIVAADLLNFAEQLDADDSQSAALVQSARTYLDTLTPEDRSAFADALSNADASAQEILKGSELAAGMLEDAGIPQKNDGYHPERYERLKQALDDALASYQ